MVAAFVENDVFAEWNARRRRRSRLRRLMSDSIAISGTGMGASMKMVYEPQLNESVGVS